MALEQRVNDLELGFLDERQATKRKDEAIVALERELRQQKEAEPVIDLKEQLAACEAGYKENLEAKDIAVAQLERTVQAKDRTIQECNIAMKRMAKYRQQREELNIKLHQQVHMNEALKKRIEDLEKDALTKAEETQHLHTKLRSFEEGLTILQNALRGRTATCLSATRQTDLNLTEKRKFVPSKYNGLRAGQSVSH